MSPATSLPPAHTLRSHSPPPSHPTLEAGPSEYVQGLTYEECATLLNVDVENEAIMGDIFDTGAGTWRHVPVVAAPLP